VIPDDLDRLTTLARDAGWGGYQPATEEPQRDIELIDRDGSRLYVSPSDVALMVNALATLRQAWTMLR
jgi:hypothetical protein